jgi:C4-dicarboxylate-specific signal transduction histidine kinase
LGSDEFAAAIAHEIGQPLSAVIAQLGAARNWLSRDPPSLSEAQSALQAADASSQRCMEILRSLRRLSRSGSMKSKKVDLNETIRRSLEPLCIREKIGARNLRLELDQDLPLITGRPVELELLFVNLLRNAIEAMDGRSGPQLLKIQTFKVGRRHVGAIVKDSGPGIPAHDADAVFDAFFTNKKDGLGIGLSLCKRIVEAHSGTLRAQNGRTRGASFEVRLPVGGGHE